MLLPQSSEGAQRDPDFTVTQEAVGAQRKHPPHLERESFSALPLIV